MHKLPDLIDTVRAKIVVCYGSAITGRKIGISKKHDIDLIIVSDRFREMSQVKRKELVERLLGKRCDLILLSSEEYDALKEVKKSIVNIALREGKVLFDDRTESY